MFIGLFFRLLFAFNTERDATDAISDASLIYNLYVSLFLNEFHGLCVTLTIGDAGYIASTTSWGGDGLTGKIVDLRFGV